MFGMPFKIIFAFILLNTLFLPNFIFGFNKLAPKINQNIDFLYKKENLVSVFYKDGEIILKGFLGVGNVYIFTIIGNPIYKIENTNLDGLNLRVNLKSNNLYIVRVQKNNSIKTFKILTN
tara:strand:+ start:85 stop:444 length:360 start_codon:yes stop_codon:yes gene_type:complete